MPKDTLWTYLKKTLQNEIWTLNRPKLTHHSSYTFSYKSEMDRFEHTPSVINRKWTGLNATSLMRLSRTKPDSQEASLKDVQNHPDNIRIQGNVVLKSKT